MSELRTEYRKLSELPPAPRNAKGHSIPALRQSLRRFGFMNPVRIDERTGLLNAGHGRVEALTAQHQDGEEPPTGVVLDPEGTWLVPVVRGWKSADDTEAEAALLADNRQTELGGWRDDVLSKMLHDQPKMPEALEAIGFSPIDISDLEDRLAHLYGDVGRGDSDAIPEPPAEPVTRPGDLWVLGGHTTCPGCGHQNPVGGSAGG